MKKKEEIRKLWKKGFTLIELIVVIAVLGILVLLAAPKFLGYTADAKLAQVKSDIKSMDINISAQLVEDPEVEKNWVALTSDEIQEMNDSNKVLNKKGEIISDIGGESYILDSSEIRSNLKGKFVWTGEDEVVYYDEGLNTSNVHNNEGGDTPPQVVTPEDKTEPEPEAPKLEYTPESNFTWAQDAFGYEVPGKGIGYFKYSGTGNEVVTIPHEIDGHKMTSYYGMFNMASGDVKKVVSDNPNITDLRNMFEASMSTDLDLSKINTSNVTVMSYMFRGAKVTSLNLRAFDTSNVTDMSNVFTSSMSNTVIDVTGWDTSKATTMKGMFYQTPAVRTIYGLEGFNTSNVTDMSEMFRESQYQEPLNLSSFDTSKVTTMKGMFRKNYSKDLLISSFNTSNVTDMSEMFRESKTKILNIKHFDTSKVTTMSAMFLSSEVTSLDLTKFNTSNVTDMSNMFGSTLLTTLDLSSFDASKVTSFGSMFSNASVQVGYARIKADADKFNSINSGKPSTMSFTVK